MIDRIRVVPAAKPALMLDLISMSAQMKKFLKKALEKG